MTGQVVTSRPGPNAPATPAECRSGDRRFSPTEIRCAAGGRGSSFQRWRSCKRTLSEAAEGEKRLAELQIKSLQETVARQAAEIETLQKQVEEAKHQVQDIAVKAIEGASGARALAHVNKIAMEQAKTRTPQG